MSSVVSPPGGSAPVTEWLRGKAAAHRRAAATYARAGDTAAADTHRRIAAELAALAVEADAYLAGMGA